jgi:hypothetical protein
MPVVVIANRAFSGRDETAPAKEITEIVLPSSLTVIGNGAFIGIMNLTKVTLPASLEEIGFNAFNGCSELNNLIIPDSLTSVKFGDWVFAGCGKLPLATRSKIEALGYTGKF